MTEDEIKLKILKSTAPKVNYEDIEARISDVNYLRFPGTNATICNITVDNKFSVRGESSSVSDDNYDEEVGKHYSYKNAFNELWPLFGFLLAEDIHREKKTKVRIGDATKVGVASIEIWLLDPVTKAYFEALGKHRDEVVNVPAENFLDADSNEKTMNEIWRRVGVRGAINDAFQPGALIKKFNLLAEEMKEDVSTTDK